MLVMSNEIVNRALGGYKKLCIARGLEASDLPLSLVARPMRILGEMVTVLLPRSGDDHIIISLRD